MKFSYDGLTKNQTQTSKPEIMFRTDVFAKHFNAAESDVNLLPDSSLSDIPDQIIKAPSLTRRFNPS